MLLEGFKIALSVERSHASGCRGGYGLTVHEVLNVSGGEDAFHAGRGGGFGTGSLGDDVVVLELELAFEQSGVRVVTDCDEDA